MYRTISQTFTASDKPALVSPRQSLSKLTANSLRGSQVDLSEIVRQPLLSLGAKTGQLADIDTFGADEETVPLSDQPEPPATSTCSHFVFSVLFFLFASLIMLSVMNWVTMNIPHDVPPLPDVGHMLIPKISPDNIADYVIISLNIYFLSFMWYFDSKVRLAFGTKFFLCYATLYLIRTVTISVTLLPPTDNHCRVDPRQIHDVVLNTLLGFFTLGIANIHCGDLMFSGHTVNITLVWLITLTYFKPELEKKQWSKIPIYMLVITISLLAVASWYFIIATRSHYTVDIVVSFVLTSLVYSVTDDFWPPWPFNKCFQKRHVAKVEEFTSVV